MTFKLTYATMFNPPADTHTRFDAAMAETRAALGATHSLHIGGKEIAGAQTDARKSPIDQRCLLGHFPVASAAQATLAMEAAQAAFPAWRATPMAERVRLLKRVAQLIEERVFHIAAALTLEVGKNRMEALGEVQETADFFNLYAEDFERQNGFDRPLPDDPLPDFRSRNRSIMRPYGAWVVIAPFNFPFALAGGPVAAALITGNTVVFKSATDTPWSGRMLADCIRDAGLPAGVFNYLSGNGREAGQALVDHPDTAGVTFTGSFDVGMRIYRSLAGGAYPRPCIAEMGGKNACIVTANADLERAAMGIVRSAFGLSGQKCSALSRVYVDASVADELTAKLQEKIAALRIGDPSLQENWMGPVTTSQRPAQLRAVQPATGRRWRPYPRRRRTPAVGRPGARLLRGADPGRGAGEPPLVPRGNVPADRHALPRRQSRGSDAPGQRFAAGPDRRLLRQRR